MMNKRGLSLIEVVIAIIVLGLAVPPLLFQITAGVQQQEAALVQQTMTQLASERMREVFTDHANPTRGYSYIVAAAYPDETAPRGLDGYTRGVEIREVSPDDFVTPQPGSGVKRFRVTVNGPGEQTLTVESFVTNVPGTAGAG